VEVEDTAAAMEGEMDAVMAENLVYRAGGFSKENFTPSLKDAESGGLSTFDSRAAVFANSTSKRAQVIDVSKLQNLRAIPDAPPPGHVSIAPIEAASLRGWAATKQSTTTHPLLKN
jgi:hypothetical protein